VKKNNALSLSLAPSMTPYTNIHDVGTNENNANMFLLLGFGQAINLDLHLA